MSLWNTARQLGLVSKRPALARPRRRDDTKQTLANCAALLAQRPWDAAKAFRRAVSLSGTCGDFAADGCKVHMPCTTPCTTPVDCSRPDWMLILMPVYASINKIYTVGPLVADSP